MQYIDFEQINLDSIIYIELIQNNEKSSIIYNQEIIFILNAMLIYTYSTYILNLHQNCLCIFLNVHRNLKSCIALMTV